MSGRPLSANRPQAVSCPTRSGFVVNDGGRAAAGYRGEAGDCVARAIAIAAELPYAEVYASLNTLAKGESRRRRRRSSAREGVHRSVYESYLHTLGFVWRPTMAIGQGCTVHLDAAQLPAGRLVVRVSKHLCAMVDGVIHDTHDPRRGGTRCVYGYFERRS